MAARIDITGQRFGRLTVIGFDRVGENRAAYWLCVCECGATVSKEGRRLRDGRVQSCGCLVHDFRARLTFSPPATAAPGCEDCGSPADLYLRGGLCVDCYGRPAAKRAWGARRSKARRDEWRAAGVCTVCGGERRAGRLRCRRCDDKQYNKSRAYRQRLKDAVFAHYGGYICSCCGETERMFLALDHIDGGGSRERRAAKLERAAGQSLYLQIARNGYRAGLRVLCHNCNYGRWLNGGECPHGTRR